MSKQNKHIILRIVLGVLLLIIVGAAGFSIWVAQHYKAVLMERLPGWVAKTTDSAYNISVEDISFSPPPSPLHLSRVTESPLISKKSPHQVSFKCQLSPSHFVSVCGQKKTEETRKIWIL